MAEAPKMIDPKKLEGLVSYGATNQEISEAMGVPWHVLEQEYPEVITRARAVRNVLIRRALYDQSERGRFQATRFLAKNVLGMSDNPKLHGPQNDGFAKLEAAIREGAAMIHRSATTKKNEETD